MGSLRIMHYNVDIRSLDGLDVDLRAECPFGLSGIPSLLLGIQLRFRFYWQKIQYALLELFRG